MDKLPSCCWRWSSRCTVPISGRCWWIGHRIHCSKGTISRNTTGAESRGHAIAFPRTSGQRRKLFLALSCHSWFPRDAFQVSIVRPSHSYLIGRSSSRRLSERRKCLFLVFQILLLSNLSGLCLQLLRTLQMLWMSRSCVKLLLRQRIRNKGLSVKPLAKAIFSRWSLIFVTFSSEPFSPYVEFEIDLGRTGRCSPVNIDLLVSQINLVFKDHKARRQTLRICTKKMLSVKVLLHRVVIAKILVLKPLLLTNM